MKGHYVYDYPRPMVTVDAAVFTVRAGKLQVLLIKRRHEPFKGMWALPGGFVNMDENLDTAAARELAEETSVTGVHLVQFGTFGNVGRDPRGRVITVAYLGIVDSGSVTIGAGDDAQEAAWMPLDAIPPLATDHNDALRRAVYFLRVLTTSRDGIIGILPDTLTLRDFEAALANVPA